MTTVWVEAPARLHLGLIDLRGDLGRRFGGLGAALVRPRVRVGVRLGPEGRSEGPDVQRGLEFARRFLRHHGIEEKVIVRVEEVIPAHVGLGSGTQLALAVARGLAELCEIEADAPALAAAVGRTARSSVGTWLFQHGGFVVEGGRRPNGPPAAPLVFQRPLPTDWRCVIAIPPVNRGLSGEPEESAFRVLARPSAETVGAIARLVLTVALPALIEVDPVGFGAAITGVQRHVGDCFREVQGGRFAHAQVARLVEDFERLRAHGAGQSSWGPAAFALAADEEQATELLASARDRLGPDGVAFITAFDNRGARWEARADGVERSDVSDRRVPRGGGRR